MTIVNKREAIILFLGDIVFLVVALWLTLLIRYFQVPDLVTWNSHFVPFSILFLIWIIIFYIAGLYRKHTLILKDSLPQTLFNTQITNIVLGILFFYFIPYFSITPKTNLFIYLIVSFGLIYIWRIYLLKIISPTQKQQALIIANGSETLELVNEINNNNRYDFIFNEVVDLSKNRIDDLKKFILGKVKDNNISIIVFDFNDSRLDPFLPELYQLIFSKVQFVDLNELYENIFDRIPLSLMNYRWFVENISSQNKFVYDILKRLMDIFIAFLLTLLSFVLYPLVVLAIWLESKTGPLIIQERVGKDNKKIRLYKFRSMTSNDRGKWIGEGDNRVTKVGKILRASRIDELPQLLNVLRGDISLIGPRPDIIGLFEKLKDQVQYYTIRNVVKPGLSGWAQTHQEIPPHSIEETKIRLSYDLYYIKNRSLILDFKIALQTLKTLISRTGK